MRIVAVGAKCTCTRTDEDFQLLCQLDKRFCGSCTHWRGRRKRQVQRQEAAPGHGGQYVTD